MLSTRCSRPTPSTCQGSVQARPHAHNMGMLKPGASRRCACKSTFVGKQLAAHSNGSLGRATMARWLENKASVEVPAPLEACWVLWEDRERIPQWMPWIKSVEVQKEDPRLSRWTLATHQFGRDWEFSWLARNLTPIKGQKIHWVSEPGSGSMPGVEIANRGQIRFTKRGPNVTGIQLAISYEVPEILVPFASALTPLVESIMSTDLRRFRDIMQQEQTVKQ